MASTPAEIRGFCLGYLISISQFQGGSLNEATAAFPTQEGNKCKNPQIVVVVVVVVVEVVDAVEGDGNFDCR